MLLTIMRGKAGRVQIPGTDASFSWRELFKGREDLLTGVVFGRFRFLSDDARQRVMALLIGPHAAEKLGKFETLELWPRLQLSGRAWVEPDVLITFEHALVLAEIKPPGGGFQSERQWRDEICALFGDDAAEGADRIYFVAMGNTRRADGEFDLDVGIEDDVRLTCHAREWAPFAAAVLGMRSSASGNDGAVFQDWIEAFGLFGIPSAPAGLADLVEWKGGKSLRLEAVWEEAAPSMRCTGALAMISALDPLVEFIGNTELEAKEWL